MSTRLYPDVSCSVLVYSLNLAIVKVILALKSPEYQYIEMAESCYGLPKLRITY